MSLRQERFIERILETPLGDSCPRYRTIPLINPSSDKPGHSWVNNPRDPACGKGNALRVLNNKAWVIWLLRNAE